MKYKLTFVEENSNWQHPNSGLVICYEVMTGLGFTRADACLLSVSRTAQKGFHKVYLDRSPRCGIWGWKNEALAALSHCTDYVFLGHNDQILDSMFPGKKEAVVWVRFSKVENNRK